MSSSDELCALADKYRALIELRLLYDKTGEVADKAVLQRLARDFPGVLRELDRLPLDEIERRLSAVDEAIRADTSEPWMEWVISYHALMRAALFIKPKVSRQPLTSSQSEALAREASTHARIEIDAAFVDAIVRPKGGRISQVVLDELVARFGASRRLIEDIVIAPRPKSRR